MKIIDNINNRLIDELKTTIKKESKLSIAASSFSIYSFEALRKELSKIEKLRFVFTSPTLIEEKFERSIRKFYIPHIYHEAELCGGEFELRLEKKISKIEGQIKREKQFNKKVKMNMTLSILQEKLTNEIKYTILLQHK